jgi:hypothetical protein
MGVIKGLNSAICNNNVAKLRRINYYKVLLDIVILDLYYYIFNPYYCSNLASVFVTKSIWCCARSNYQPSTLGI